MTHKVNTIEEGNKLINGHFVMKCSCGAVLNSCRCAGPNKQIIIVRNGCGSCKKEAAADSLLRIAQKGGISPIDQD